MLTCETIAEARELFWEGLLSVYPAQDTLFWFWFNCQGMV